MREEIEKRRAEAAEKKKQKEEEPTKPAFTISPKGSSKVSFGAKVRHLRAVLEGVQRNKKRNFTINNSGDSRKSP